MASLIPGFEYDIFISYRHKDNKYDGWVTEFVDNLKRELESTFKEDINVYFDTNPHDGLLETHDVDASLKEKLKCLIFIPVISRIYCDPKSFAWEHEFMAFIEQASSDKYGLKVKLPNGNVASRVLPVRIHDLDEADIKLCESTLGGVLRGVEFIYKSAGINRPLRSMEDKPHDNLNNTIYRDQINKTALAIRELLNGIKEQSDTPVTGGVESQPATMPGKSRLIPVVASIVVVIAALFVIYPFLFRKKNDKVVVAVMPFQNITNDTTLDYWQDGMQIGIINGLSGSEDLEIRSREAITRNLEGKGITSYASVTPSVARKTAAEIGSNVNIQGSIMMTGSKVQINAQINDSRKDVVLSSFNFSGPRDEEWILKIMDSLSLSIQNFLMTSKLIKEQPRFEGFTMTKSAEALKYYMYSENALSKSDWEGVVYWTTKAIELDSNFIGPLGDITWAYMNLDLYDEAKKSCQRYYSKKDRMTMLQKNQAELVHLTLFGTFEERLNFLKQLVEVSEDFHFMLGGTFLSIGQYDQAVSEFEKHLKLLASTKIDKLYRLEYENIGTAFHKAGLYKKEKDLYERAERDFPDKLWLIGKQASLSMITGDTAASNDYVRKFISIAKEKMAPDQQINMSLVTIYTNGGNPDKAEAILRHEVLSKDPDNPELLNWLAWFLIDKDRSVDEGLQLVERALKIMPDNYAFLDTKGWGLYKQHKYQEALACLEKSWSLLSVHDQGVYTHLQLVKKAIADQN